MPKVTSFDKPTCRKMTNDLANILKEFEREWGVHVEMRGGSFDTLSFRPKIEISIPNAQGGKTYAKERRAWNLYASMEGLQPGWLDRKFVTGGKTLMVAGFMPRRTKNPVLLLDDNGKVYHGSIELVKLHLSQLDKVA